MNKSILILGASGNFGSKIAKSLAKYNFPLVLAGRRKENLIELKNQISSQSEIDIAAFDIYTEIHNQLTFIKPFIVINTCGPFQSADYSVAESCIRLGIHYIDLADGRDFVRDIRTLNAKAKEHNCFIVSGASTVPCLSSAVIEHYKNQFSSIDSLLYGITPGQKTERGLATTQSILSYTGKVFNAGSKTIYGWQDLYRQEYPILGKRWMANCDIPDLDLFPEYYGIREIRFSAGLESNVLHLSLWILSWLVRIGVPLNLEKHAKIFLRLSHLFDRFGSNDGGMHMIISGKDKQGQSKTIKWFIVARKGDGPQIPTIPAIILVKKLMEGTLVQSGAVPCMNLVTFDEYVAELLGFEIKIFSDEQRIEGVKS